MILEESEEARQEGVKEKSYREGAGGLVFSGGV